MDKHAANRIVGILLIYTVFFVLASQIDPRWFVLRILSNLAGITGLFEDSAKYVVGVSFGCMLLWFALGEWAIQGWAAARTWYLTWVVLFLVIVAGALYYWSKGIGMVLIGQDSEEVLGCYLGIGILPFYISSVLFTPVNGRYYIWPARHVVKW